MKKFEIAIFYIFLAALLIALSFACCSINSDLWARLLQGEAVLQTGHVLTQDPFSYVDRHVWIDHEWGSGVVFAIILNAFGYGGLIVFKAFLIFAIFFFIIQTLKLQEVKSTKLYNFLFFFLVINSAETLLLSGIRCHLFTFLFFTFFIYILELVRKRGKDKLLILLPFLMIFWANVHGGCVSGIGLLFIYAIGEFFNKKPCKHYLLTLLGCVAAMFINPYGFDYIKFLFMATTMQRNMIAEWQNIFEIGSFELIKAKIFYILAIITAVYSFFSNKKSGIKFDYTKILLLITTCFLAILHLKHSPFFIINATIFLYDKFFELFNGGVGSVRNLLKLNSEIFLKKFVFVKEAGVYIFVFLGIASVLYLNHESVSARSLKEYPVKIVEFMKINDLKGNILNNFGIGSYISYKLYPQNLIYMDGRYEEVYYDSTTEDNWNFFNAEKNWDLIFKKYGLPEYIIVNKNDGIFPVLADFPLYKNSFKDNSYNLFIRVDLARKEFIQPKNDKKYYIKTYFDKMFKYNEEIVINGQKVQFK